MCSKHVHSTLTRSSRFHCLIGVINKPTTVELCISPVYRRLAVAKFSKFPPQPFLLLLRDSLHVFPRLFTVISEHMCFVLLVFLFLYFLVVVSLR